MNLKEKERYQCANCSTLVNVLVDSLHYTKSKSFLVPCAPLSMLGGPGWVLLGPPNIDNVVHGTEKLLLILK